MHSKYKLMNLNVAIYLQYDRLFGTKKPIPLDHIQAKIYNLRNEKPGSGVSIWQKGKT